MVDPCLTSPFADRAIRPSFHSDWHPINFSLELPLLQRAEGNKSPIAKCMPKEVSHWQLPEFNQSQGLVESLF